MRDAPVLQHPRLEPLADQPQQDAVTYPPAEDRAQVAVVQGVEKLSDVDLQDPPATDLHQPVPEGVQCLVRRAARPEAVRAVQEVLLVDRLQDHRYRTLEDLILERGD